MTTTEYADSLRQIADFYDAHPDLPIPYGDIRILSMRNDKEEIARVTKILSDGGKVKKQFLRDYLYVERDFGSLTVSAVEYRTAVCKKIVTKKTVTRQVPLTFETREVEEEEVTWECSDPILAPTAPL